MIHGEVVKVLLPVGGEVDPFNKAAKVREPIEVANVLVEPMAGKDVLESNRDEGVEVSYTLHFPKEFTESLRGALIEVRDGTFSVVGDPKPYTLANTPLYWSRSVEVVAING